MKTNKLIALSILLAVSILTPAGFLAYKIIPPASDALGLYFLSLLIALPSIFFTINLCREFGRWSTMKNAVILDINWLELGLYRAQFSTLNDDGGIVLNLCKASMDPVSLIANWETFGRSYYIPYSHIEKPFQSAVEKRNKFPLGPDFFVTWGKNDDDEKMLNLHFADGKIRHRAAGFNTPVSQERSIVDYLN